MYVISELMETDLHRIIQSKQALCGMWHDAFQLLALHGLKFHLSSPPAPPPSTCLPSRGPHSVLHLPDSTSAQVHALSEHCSSVSAAKHALSPASPEQPHTCHTPRLTPSPSHSDLKPANILLNSSCELKLCDLGLARGIDDEKGTAVVLTEYVVTRWYRAPEIMLASREYGPPVDMWAVGCIMAELYLRKPLFPGKDYLHQLRMIVEMLGSPSDEDLGFITSSRALEFIHNLPAAPPRSFERTFPTAPPAALDLLRKMLCFNPAKRITVEQALAHPYMEGLHAPDDEPACDHKFNFDWEAEAVDATSLRRLLWREAKRLSPAMPDF